MRRSCAPRRAPAQGSEDTSLRAGRQESAARRRGGCIAHTVNHFYSCTCVHHVERHVEAPCAHKHVEADRAALYRESRQFGTSREALSQPRSVCPQRHGVRDD